MNTTRLTSRRLAKTLGVAMTLASLVAAGCTNNSRAAASPDVSTVASSGSEAFSVFDLESRWTTQSGDTLALRDLGGKVSVVAMIYTSCKVTCPLIIGDLKRIEASLPAPRKDSVRFVLVSLDPNRDVPDVLAKFAHGAGLDPAHWTLLNGSSAAVRELAATIGVRYEMLTSGDINHSNVITVLDRTGAVAYQQTGVGTTGETIKAVDRLIH